MHVQTCNQYVRLGLFLCVCVCCIKRVCMLVARRHSAPLCLLSRRLSLIYCMERKKKHPNYHHSCLHVKCMD